MNINKKELEKFLEYLQDKIEDCYKKETEAAIKDFLNNNKQDLPSFSASYMSI